MKPTSIALDVEGRWKHHLKESVRLSKYQHERNTEILAKDWQSKILRQQAKATGKGEANVQYA